MESAFLSSIRSKASQVLGFVQRCAVSPSSSSDPCSSVLKDLKKLEKASKRIQAVLHDAEEKEIRDEAVKLWLKELKGVAYDAEDVLDEYHYEVLRAQVESRASLKKKRVEGDDEEEVSASLSTMVVSIPDGIGDRIREIRERFDEISEDRERLRLREEDGERRVLKVPYPAPTSHVVEESSTFGRERDKEEVIDLLLSEGMGNVISVVPIVGKGGLGKTTIAQLVCNDSEVKGYFDLVGWVCASDDFDVTRLTKAINESLTRRPCHLAQLSALQNTLMEKIRGRKVLLVLDDVWNEQRSRWESLTNPFVCAKTVRIIVTCRNESVAKIMQTDASPYHPGYLSPEDSWSLFRHYAFGGQDPEERSCLADIGKQIVNKCSGLPLAVKTMGSLLRHEMDEDSWMEVLRSDLWELDRSNEILGSLRLSYSRMPAHLKPCFVYCSTFPKDFEFDSGELVRLWMAQGYIPSRGRRRMEDVGHEYFNDLVGRSLFDSSHHGFKMHDMIHDLAKFIAENECYAIEDEKLPDSPEKVRHLYAKDVEELVKSPSLCNLRALRTLLQQNQYERPMVILMQKMTQLLPLLRCLRVLEFSWEWLDEIPDLLGNLKHLRYLCIQSMYIKKLPGSVCLLYHLQTLILYCDLLVDLPSGMANLMHLRYFRIRSSCMNKLPESICHLHHLQTLMVECHDLAELPYMGNLTILRHFHLKSSVVERLHGSICQLCNLQTLDLNGCANLEELPSGIESLANLRHLDISHTQIYCLPVAIQKLRNLQSLLANYKMQGLGGMGVVKAMVGLVTLTVSGIRNVVNIEDARDANLKNKHELRQLRLYWNEVNREDDALDWPDIDVEYDAKSLYLNYVPEENKDAPTDEKRKEVMLEYLQPHFNLKFLVINGYGGSKLPKWVGNPFSLASLRQIHIIDCKNIRSIPLYIHEPVGRLDASISRLKKVYISGCRQLTSIAGLHNLHLLKNLKVCNCPQLRLLSKEGLPSNLEDLHMEKCQQLTSLSTVQNLTSLRALTIKNCPKLQIMGEDHFSSMPYDVVIVDCPGLSNWCQIQKINCFQVASGNKLTISNTWENMKQGFNDLTFIEHGFDESSASRIELLQPRSHLFLSNHWQFFWETPVSLLEELTIWSCTSIPPLWFLSWSRSLHSLVIKDCPRVELLPDELLPSMLRSLVVDSCENLRSLQLAQANRDALEELQIVNCPMLVMVEGLNCRFFPKYLRIEECPQLSLSQKDMQPFIPPLVENAGVFEMRFYPPHSEEIENKEAIDGGT